MISLVFVITLLLAPIVWTQAPKPSQTYDSFIDVSSLLTDGVGTPPTYHVYYSVRPNTMHMALVCENFGGWCAFGWSPTCGMIGSDAVVGYVDSVTSLGFVQDFYLQGKTFPTAASCNSFTVAGNNSACADGAKEASLDCVNNAQFVAANNTNSTFMTIEFTRPLVASDQCDVAIPLNTSFCVIFSLGQFQSGGAVDPWPNNIAQHEWRATPGLQIIWNIPANFTTSTATATTATTATATTATATTATATTATATATTATTATATTATATTATGTSSSTGSPTSGTNCNNLANQCQTMCGASGVVQCTCVNNTPVAECGSLSAAAIGFVAVELVVAMIFALLV